MVISRGVRILWANRWFAWSSIAPVVSSDQIWAVGEDLRGIERDRLLIDADDVDTLSDQPTKNPRESWRTWCAGFLLAEGKTKWANTTHPPSRSQWPLSRGGATQFGFHQRRAGCTTHYGA